MPFSFGHVDRMQAYQLPLLIIPTMPIHPDDFIDAVGSIAKIIPLIDHMLCGLCAKFAKFTKSIIFYRNFDRTAPVAPFAEF